MTRTTHVTAHTRSSKVQFENPFGVDLRRSVIKYPAKLTPPITQKFKYKGFDIEIKSVPPQFGLHSTAHDWAIKGKSGFTGKYYTWDEGRTLGTKTDALKMAKSLINEQYQHT